MKNRTILISVLLCLAAGAVYFFGGIERAPEIRHVVLISIDTCRADYLSCYGYPRKTTPNIDKLAREAIRFEHVVSPVPITLPAHCSMLTGTIPPIHGVHENIGYRLDRSNLTLQEILRQNGFNTSAIVSSFVLDKMVGLSQGFDSYYDHFEKTHRIQFYNERKGDKTTQIALDWLERNSLDCNPSFLFLHYYDPHNEYDPPEPYATEFADNLYAGEIAFTDHCIGQIIRRLKELNMYDSTLLIITGDHGEMLGEHGEDEHTYFIYESAIRVPLIIKLPGQREGRVVRDPVGLVDIVPTVCSLLNIKVPSQVQGRDLSAFLYGKTPENYTRYLYSESMTPNRLGASSLMAISTGKWKYIQAPRPELYNLAADPEEQNNLFEKEPHRARILEDKLLEKLEQSVRQGKNNRIKMDAETIRRLESLGYVGGKTKDKITFDRNKEDPKDLIGVFAQYLKALKRLKYKDYEEAKRILLDLVPQRPNFFEIYMQLGDIGACTSNFVMSIENYRKAYKLNSDQPMILNNLAWIQATRPSLATRRDMDEALECAKKLCALSSFNNPHALDTLAVTYAARGEFRQAVETEQQAYNLSMNSSDTEFTRKLKKRLELFKKSKPYVEDTF